MKKHIVLLSKDATLPEYYGPYGGKYTNTPNIDELAQKGTVFKKHYTAAPSTAMAFTAMFTGKYAHETGHSYYTEVDEYDGETLFDTLYNKGYQCHLLWSSNYISKAEKFSKCYGKATIHHEALKFNVACGFNAAYQKENRQRDEQLAEDTFESIIREVDTIDYLNNTIFLWIHMPHCMYGRISYGDDIDLFDRLVGEMRKRFGDDGIFVTADHGHMNGFNGKYGYGFDVNESATHIPLIAPKINDSSSIDFLTSNVQLKDIILNRKVQPLEYTFSDCAYYAQPHRKLAIIKDNMYYIYSKRTKKEEMYDLELDPNQNINLLDSFFVNDADRLCVTDIRQVVLYPHWDEIDSWANEFRKIRDAMWKNGTKKQEAILRWKFFKGQIAHGLSGIVKNFK